MLQMHRVDAAHARESGRTLWLRQVVHAAAAADAEPLRLSGHRNRVRAVAHRLARSTPALLRAPPKKSFSSGSSPSLACSVFTSTAGSQARPSPAHTCGALASNCSFHCTIWLACTSKRLANSASVAAPFNATNATLALNAGE